MHLDRRSFITGSLASGALVACSGRAEAADASLTFAFASEFWMNLHHRLYAEAAVVDAVRHGAHPQRPMSLAIIADRGQLPTREAAVWDTAVSGYIDGGFSKRDLLASDMIEIKSALRDLSRSASPAATAIPAAMREALVRAAPVYERTFWPADDSANTAWVAALSPILKRYGAAVTRWLRRVYQSDWPLGPYAVDVVRYGSMFTAYTTIGPVHIVTDSFANTGGAALEILFHEASHAVVVPDAGTVGTAIENAVTLVAGREPRGLWHAVIFYSVGQVVAELLRRDGQSYTMYADAHQLWNGEWTGFRDAFDRHWLAYVRGTESSMQDAMNGVVRELVR